MRFLFGSYVAICLCMSVAAFVAFGIDKRQARLERRRISEATLHRLSFLGGWPGALMGQRLFHHKTQKRPFIWWLRFAVLLHVGLLTLLCYLAWQSVHA